MTDLQAQQRAERLVEKLNRLRADIQGGYETADSPVTIITAELLAVQRECIELICLHEMWDQTAGSENIPMFNVEKAIKAIRGGACNVKKSDPRF